MSYACAQCNIYYNLTTRKPIELNCQCTICMECHQNLANDRLQKVLTCPQCSATSIKSDKPRVNEMIMRKIETQNSLFITCDNHQTEMASHYCIECESPVCTYCQLEDTHSSHQIVRMSRSQFTDYTTNVLRIFDEYQIDNMESLLGLLGQQRDNEISLDSKKLKQTILRVTRMLGPHIDEDETTQIDFKRYLLDPQNLQQKIKKFHSKFTSQDFNDLKQMIQKQIHQQLKESQTLIKTEFQQTIGQNNNINSLQQQIENQIKKSTDDQQRVMHEFKKEMHDSINYYNPDLSNKIKAIDDINQKQNQQESLIQKFEQSFQSLREVVESQKIDQDIFAQKLQDSQSSFKQEIKSDIDTKLHKLETRIQALKKENEQLNEKFINIDLNYSFQIQKAQESQCNCQKEFKLLDNKFAEYSDKIESIKQSTKKEINVQANKLLEFQQSVKSIATQANIDKINQELNSQDKQRQKFESEFQNLKKSIQSIQQNQDQQTKDFKQIQSKSKQDIDKLTETLHTISIKHEQQKLQECKLVQNAFDQKLTSLEQQLKFAQSTIQDFKNQIKSLSQRQSQQLQEKMRNQVNQDTLTNEQLQNTNQLKQQTDQEMISENNSQIEEEEEEEEIEEEEDQEEEEEEEKEEVNKEEEKEEEVKSSTISQLGGLFNYHTFDRFSRLFMKPQVEQKPETINANIATPVQEPSVEDFVKQSILDKKKLFRDLVDQEINKTWQSLLRQQISEYSNKQYKLLYCGSRDGFNAYKFHQLCDNKGPTVSFILSEYGLVFCGYTSISWASSSYIDQWHSDPTAFVFSLSKRSIHKQYQNQHKAVQNYKDSMCLFGYDIVISDNCDKNRNSYCNLGYTYELPNGYEYGSDESRSYLAGQKKFKVLEIQVYSLQ
eukprot:403372508